jgi:hypothetical protein
MNGFGVFTPRGLSKYWLKRGKKRKGKCRKRRKLKDEGKIEVKRVKYSKKS